ncbi:MAG TPA: serine/threonine-protein kinase [Roseateles sp.]
MTATHRSLVCPQCGGSLPRQALWRTVDCSYCKAVVTLNDHWVERAEFHAAWTRARARPAGGEWLTLRGADYRLIAPVGQGEQSTVWLAERHGTARLRAVVKIAPLSARESLSAEAETLWRLQGLTGPGSSYFSLRLPQPLVRDDTSDRALLALRAWPGFWGSLADVLALHPQGIGDARHGVWLWRRVLELLDYLHNQGWCHGDLRPEHWLIHPADHGVHLVGWRRASRSGDPATDLQQSAWAVRIALSGDGDAPPALGPRCPPALARLLQRASEDRRWCRGQGAAGLMRELSAAALADFGPPRFVAFDPQRA